MSLQEDRAAAKNSEEQEEELSTMVLALQKEIQILTSQRFKVLSRRCGIVMFCGYSSGNDA